MPSCIRQDQDRQIMSDTAEVIRKAINLLCGRIGGCLGETCGCVKGTLDMKPSSEVRRKAAWNYLCASRSAVQIRPFKDALGESEATKRAMAGPEIPHNEAGVPIIPIPRREEMDEYLAQRDKLWCECLIANLDPREISLVLREFNRERPDQEGQVAESQIFPTLAEIRQRFDNLLSSCIEGKGPTEYNLLLDRLVAATVERPTN